MDDDATFKASLKAYDDAVTACAMALDRVRATLGAEVAIGYAGKDPSRNGIAAFTRIPFPLANDPEPFDAAIRSLRTVFFDAHPNARPLVMFSDLGVSDGVFLVDFEQRCS